MKRIAFPSWINARVKQFQEERLKLLRQVQFSDLFKSRSFLSGEIELASDFVYYRFDEYFDKLSSSLFQELILDLTAKTKSSDAQYDVVRRIGHYTYDPEFEEEWLRLQNLFTSEFMNRYVAEGRISWQKLDEDEIAN